MLPDISYLSLDSLATSSAPKRGLPACDGSLDSFRDVYQAQVILHNPVGCRGKEPFKDKLHVRFIGVSTLQQREVGVCGIR